MANFYTSEKIAIQSMEDIVNRRRYESSIPPQKLLNCYVLAVYSFPRKLASCSVSDCYQNHRKGYLIRTYEDKECNICESCAKRFLGPEALKPLKRETRKSTGPSVKKRGAVTEAASRQMGTEIFVAETARVKERVKELQLEHQGANWLYKSLNQFRKSYPAEVLTALEDLRQRGDESGVLEKMIETNASDKQLQDIEQLQGLEVLTGDIRALLIEQVLKPLTDLEKKANSAGPGGKILVPIAWSAQVESNLEAAQLLIENARLFFSEDNIERLNSLPLSEEAARKVRSMHWDSDKGMPKRG